MGATGRAQGIFGRDQLAELAEADIRAELEAHLVHATAARVAAGVEPEEARRAAREALGDVEALVRDCKRQKLGGRIMLQRIHLVATLALIVGTLYFAYQTRVLSGEVEDLAEHGERLTQLESLLGAEPAGEGREADGVANGHAIATSEIYLSPGDRIHLVPTYNEELRRSLSVERDGTILLTPVGHIQVAGLTRAELEELLARKLEPYYDLLQLYARVDRQ